MLKESPMQQVPGLSDSAGLQAAHAEHFSRKDFCMRALYTWRLFFSYPSSELPDSGHLFNKVQQGHMPKIMHA